jgi:nucleotide-binding universal stress UspA family protein
VVLRRILVGHAGSECAQRAFEVALDLAARCGAELHTVSVLAVRSHVAATMGEVIEEREEEAKIYAQVEETARRLGAARGVTVPSRTITGHEVEAIVGYARQGGFDLLVIGFMGHSRVFGRIWGGTSQNLTRLAPCSVLVVK